MEFRRIFDLLTLQKEQSTVFYDKKELQWQSLTIEKSIAQCNRMSAGLLNLGLEAGDRIMISAAKGSSYWLLLIQAALQIELVIVPFSSTSTAEQALELMRATQAKFAFVESRTDYNRFQEITEGLQHFNQVLAFHDLPGLESFEGLMTEPSPTHLETIQVFKAAIHEDDLAIILSKDDYLTYFSHKQILTRIQDLLTSLQPKPNQKAISFLAPNTFLEFLLLHTYLAAGVSIYFPTSSLSLTTVLNKVKPDFVGLKSAEVEHLKDYLYKQTTRNSKISRKRTIWSIKIGEAYGEDALAKLQYRLQHKLADWWRFRKWRRLLGGYLHTIIVDTTTKSSTAKLFRAAFIPILHYNPEATNSAMGSSEN